MYEHRIVAECVMIVFFGRLMMLLITENCSTTGIYLYMITHGCIVVEEWPHLFVKVERASRDAYQILEASPIGTRRPRGSLLGLIFVFTFCVLGLFNVTVNCWFIS